MPSSARLLQGWPRIQPQVTVLELGVGYITAAGTIAAGGIVWYSGPWRASRVGDRQAATHHAWLHQRGGQEGSIERHRGQARGRARADRRQPDATFRRAADLRVAASAGRGRALR